MYLVGNIESNSKHGRAVSKDEGDGEGESYVVKVVRETFLNHIVPSIQRKGQADKR